MSGQGLHAPVKAVRALLPSLMYMGREEVPPALVRDIQAGLAPLWALRGTAGRGFEGSASVRYTLNFVITRGAFRPSFEDEVSGETSLSGAGLVEIANYDPVRRTIMAIGTAEPAVETPLHWFAYRCFPDRKACLYMAPFGGGAGPAGVPRVDVGPGVWSSDACLLIMERLKQDPCVSLADGSVVVTGADLKEAAGALVEAFRADG